MNSIKSSINFDEGAAAPYGANSLSGRPNGATFKLTTRLPPLRGHAPQRPNSHS